MLASPALRGGFLALLAAALFGVSTPLVQYFGRGLGPLTTAALLYAGAAFAGALLRKPAEQEARLRRSDWKRLLAVVLLGAVLGPVALAWGLQRTSGASASLMLTLEALFTAVLAWRLYHETMDRRVCVAMALLLVGGGVLIVDQGQLGNAQLLGLLAVTVATAAWGIDNAVSRALAERDPGQVVLLKCALGATITGALALGRVEALPTLAAAVGLLLVGATGYGASLRFYLLAQRTFGAARTSSVFAFAPFIGAVIALVLGDRSASALMVTGALLMLGGVILHLMEAHGHDHTHETMDHDHAHDHADGHHNHTHDVMPVGRHSHTHHHAPQRHSHPHVPDAHHQHRH